MCRKFFDVFVVIVLMTCPKWSLAEDMQGLVIGITDGDTLRLLTPGHTQFKVRLSGIDAPEKSQPFGQQSKETLAECALDKEARIDANKKDRYGRTVGKVIVSGVDCNLRQIKLGMAWHYKKYENEQDVEDRSLYGQAEYLAKQERRGLWAESSPIAPWDYRKAK